MDLNHLKQGQYQRENMDVNPNYLEQSQYPESMSRQISFMNKEEYAEFRRLIIQGWDQSHALKKVIGQTDYDPHFQATGQRES